MISLIRYSTSDASAMAISSFKFPTPATSPRIYCFEI